MPLLKVKQPYLFRGFDVPDAVVKIDWVSFDRCEGRAEIVLGLYRVEADSDPAQSKTNRLDTVHLVFQNGRSVVETIDGEQVTSTQDEYNELTAQYPEIFMGIVGGVSELAVTKRPELFILE